MTKRPIKHHILKERGKKEQKETWNKQSMEIQKKQQIYLQLITSNVVC